MEQTIEFLAFLTRTPLPTLLVIAGLAFIALAIVRKAGPMDLDPRGRNLAAGFGSALVVLGLALGSLDRDSPQPNGQGGTFGGGVGQDSSRVPPKVPQDDLTEDVLTNSNWTFLHGEGDVIAANVRLDPSGAVVGVDHPNESRWEFVDGKELVFFHRDGYPTTRFTRVELVRGKWQLFGKLLVPGHLPVVWHILRQR